MVLSVGRWFCWVGGCVCLRAAHARSALLFRKDRHSLSSKAVLKVEHLLEGKFKIFV